MILIGNQRAGGKQMADHLLKDDNDHVMVHEVSGFISDTIHGAMKEAHALSRGTKCKQYLYSLSLNPPADKYVSDQDFEIAIGQVEAKLGLSGQPRVIVFHEKKGPDRKSQPGLERRHCHVVWSRVNGQEMKAIELSHSKRKLMDVSRDLYRQFGWEKEMPKGFLDRTKRDPRNFTLAEWQQAQRQAKDPRDIKQALQDAWVISDDKRNFEQALSERGFLLASGKRPFLAVDMDGDVHALPRALKVRTKDLRAKLGSEQQLQTLEQAQSKVSKEMATVRGRLKEEIKRQRIEHLRQAKTRRYFLIERQRIERANFVRALEDRQQKEAVARAARFRKGLPGLWDLVRGENKRLRESNELEARRCQIRDNHALEKLIQDQLNQRRTLMQERLQTSLQLRGVQREINTRSNAGTKQLHR